MALNINIKRKFKINGKEYNSIEEMPHDVRDIFEKALASQAGAGRQASPATMQFKISFNDQKYNNIDAMPRDVRQLYEKVLKTAETGAVSPGIVAASDINVVVTGPKTGCTAGRVNMGAPLKDEPAFSKRSLIISVMLIALIFLLYYFWKSR